MKKIYTAMIIGTILSNSVPAFAACNRTCSTSEANEAYVVNDTEVCNGVRNEACQDGVIFASCTSCADSRAKLVKKTEVMNGCSYSYTTCECNACTNCTSDTTWVSAGTGYEKKTTAECDCGTCTKSTSYRCAAGYYGSSSNGTSGCTKCPSGGNSSAGSTSITSCCLPVGAAFSDSTGSGTYTSSCCYSN